MDRELITKKGFPEKWANLLTELGFVHYPYELGLGLRFRLSLTGKWKGVVPVKYQCILSFTKESKWYLVEVKATSGTLELPRECETGAIDYYQTLKVHDDRPEAVESVLNLLGIVTLAETYKQEKNG